MTVVSCAGVPIASCTLNEATQEVIRLAQATERGVDVHLCNAFTIALADQEPVIHSLLREATVNFPDGQSLVWANRMRYRELNLPRERVCGPDLFRNVFDLGQDVGLRHYLLGSTPEVLAQLGVNLRKLYPRAQIVGVDSPPFRPLTDEEYVEQAERIRRSTAQIVWVGLGTPKQDLECARLKGQLPLVFAAVGAAFDFVAGNKKRPPRWVQRAGLEWAFRLGHEPQRLWKRYLFGNARFVRAVVFSRD